MTAEKEFVTVKGVSVLDTERWYFGRCNDHGSTSGLGGQITKAIFNGVIFYTRENVNAIDSFNISSSERWGDKTGSAVRRERQSLELAAPVEHWQEIAIAVKAADKLKRPVFSNRNFTIPVAEKYFE